MESCDFCGCTDHAACPGGCYWVAEALCSRCDRVLNRLGTICNMCGAAWIVGGVDSTCCPRCGSDDTQDYEAPGGFGKTEHTKPDPTSAS